MGATDLLPRVSILIVAVIPGSRLSCYYSFLHGSMITMSPRLTWKFRPALLDEGRVTAVQVTGVQSWSTGG